MKLSFHIALNKLTISKKSLSKNMFHVKFTFHFFKAHNNFRQYKKTL